MRILSTLTLALAAAAVASPAWTQEPQPAPAPAPPTVASQPITIDQALEIAFKNSPTLRISADQLQRQMGVIAEARASFNPRFDAQAAYQRQGPPVSFQIPGTTQTANIVPESNTTAQATAFLPLDISRRLRYASDVAELQFQIDYLNLLGTAEQLILDVKSAYYDVLRALGQQDVAQAAVDVAMAGLKDAQARFNAGVAAKFDVTSAETNVANLNQALIQAQNRVELARTNLNRVMGIDVNTSTQVVKTDVPVTQASVDIPEQVKQAEARRSEVKASQTAIELNRRNVRLQKTGNLPTLGVSGAYNYSFETTGFGASNGNWNAALTLSVPIWDGGITRARVQQARAGVQTAEDTLDLVVLGVGTETRTAALNLQQAAKRVSTTAQNVTLAEEALRLATVRYNAGISILVEVTDAESQLTRARFNYVDAQYDYAVALAQLQRATSTQPETQKLQLLGGVPASS